MRGGSLGVMGSTGSLGSDMVGFLSFGLPRNGDVRSRASAGAFAVSRMVVATIKTERWGGDSGVGDLAFLRGRGTPEGVAWDESMG